ncbi:MAG: complex I NDUFA9 subunit family protein, partial [Caulobacterales bacterium]|nr:complex I NDUFA9 subunit family protein [Caulobacterales bacterium]
RQSVERAVEGADGVVNLVAVLFGSGKQRFKALHVEGARTVAEAAAEAGVARLAHISAIGADPRGKSRYARTKGEGEAAVRAAFPEATILRPSIVFGPEDDFFNRFADMARYGPALPLIGGGKTKFQPIYAGDVAAAAVAALARPEARGRVYELGGPRVYSFKELAAFILEETDRRRMLAHVPYFFASWLGAAGELSALLPFVSPFLTRDQVRSLKADSIVGAGGPDLGTLEDLGVRDPETIEAIVPSYLERYRRYGQFHETAA